MPTIRSKPSNCYRIEMKPVQQSKNSWCNCKSGKRYWQCCRKKLPPPGLLEKARRMFAEQGRREKDYQERYGYARPAMAVRAFGDKVMIAIGSRLYQQTRDGDYTFLDAIHDHALDFFGVQMLEAEEMKPLNERHPALQWMAVFVDHTNKLHDEANANPREGQIGAGAAWYRFAYDLYTIADNAKLEALMKRRLLDVKMFQGARHELWVAALCITAGFTLEFEDETDNTMTHFEFVAVDRFSPTRIAVEAKSRHRYGVKGFVGGKDVPPGATVGIRDLVLSAYKKQTNLPFYVFVDVNLPPAATEEIWEGWLLELNKTMWELEQEGYSDPSPDNAIFFANDPSHFLRDEQIGHDADRLWLKHYQAMNPRTPHPTPDLIERFRKAHRQRNVPPVDLVDSNTWETISRKREIAS